MFIFTSNATPPLSYYPIYVFSNRVKARESKAASVTEWSVLNYISAIIDDDESLICCTMVSILAASALVLRTLRRVLDFKFE